MRNVCSIDGCDSVVKAHGLCDKHWQRVKHTGTTDAGPRAPAPIEVRFWRKVDKRTPEECWRWLGSTKAGAGYGRLGAGGRGGRYLLVHRYSCELHHGSPPTPQHVAMHSCDTPSCVNPNHLRWGSASENIKEAFDKQRKFPAVKRGKDHPSTVLNEDQARFIKANPAMGAAKLARLFGCKVGPIRGVLEGRTWKHI